MIYGQFRMLNSEMQVIFINQVRMLSYQGLKILSKMFLM